MSYLNVTLLDMKQRFRSLMDRLLPDEEMPGQSTVSGNEGPSDEDVSTMSLALYQMGLINRVPQMPVTALGRGYLGRLS